MLRHILCGRKADFVYSLMFLFNKQFWDLQLMTFDAEAGMGEQVV
jgi:hypothetical protein